MPRHVLTEAKWGRLQPLLPPRPAIARLVGWRKERRKVTARSDELAASDLGFLRSAL
jgi:hypothetical protein